MTRILATVAALTTVIAAACVGAAWGTSTAEPWTVTETVTAPPVTVTIEAPRTPRAARALPDPRTTPERRSTAHLRPWEQRYWDRAQTWAQTPKARAVIACESGNRPTAVSPTGKYRGLWQMDADAWASYGGLPHAPRPDLASREAQNYVAFRLYTGRGWTPWTCA